MLLCTLVLSQLDYANSLLSRTPKTIIKPYQTVQNFAARVAYKKSRREDVNMCLTTTSLAACQIQNCVQVAHSGIQCCPWKGPTLSHWKVEEKGVSYNHQTIIINWHNSGCSTKQEKVIC